MIYTDLTKRAMKLAFDAHKGQVDKSGMPYIYHPVHLAEQMDDEYSICVALLHDTVEDTDMTFEKLAEYGLPNDVIDALKILTYDDSVPYMDYVKIIKDNYLARKVKMADLAHNSNLSRLNMVDEKSIQRTRKYFEALILLNDNDAYKNAHYFVMDKTRLVMMNDNLFYSISDSGQWIHSSYDASRYYDAAYDYEEFVIN